MNNRLTKKKSVVLLLSILTITQLIVIAFRIDFWPFSCYPMFSNSKTVPTTGAYQLFVTKGNGILEQVPMEGHKQTWFVLNRLETDVNGEAEKLKAEKIMKDNYKSYREKVGRSGDDHKQLQLFFTNVSKSQNADKFIQERKLIYSIEL